MRSLVENVRDLLEVGWQRAERTDASKRKSASSFASRSNEKGREEISTHPSDQRTWR